MAAESGSADALLADAIGKMDALTKRMDALEVGEKHIIKGDDDDDKKSKRDDAKASKSDDDDDDDRKKDDDATAPKTKILDDAKGASKDDAAKSPVSLKKKDDDGELEIKHKGEGRDDKKKADAKKADDDDDDDKKKSDDDDDDKKKSDDDDDDKKDDSARTDAVIDLRRQIADQKAVIDRLQAMMKPRSDDEHAAFADAQSRADTVFAGFGQRAPRPLEGELLFDYRKRLATKLKGYSQMWKNVKFSRLDEETFSPIENQVYADATAAANNPMDLEAGELRAVTKIDPQTGVRSIVFYGKESFVKQMGRPGRRVAAFRTMAST
jgi:hypothetical protein